MQLVPEAGIEPARVLPRGILSPVRLPISPLRQRGKRSRKLWHSDVHELPHHRGRDRQDAAGGAAAHRRGREPRARQCGPGQARRQQSGRLGEGPAGPVDDQARRGARRDQARRHADRGDLGQHRHRAGHGRGDQGLPHGADHARGPVGRTRADHEGVRRRADAHAQERRHGVRARPGREHAARRQGPRARPVRQRRTTRASTTRPPGPSCGPTPRAGSPISSARWAPPARSPACRAS